MLKVAAEDTLADELVRTREVWNNFVHNLCHGFYPERTPGSRTHGQFKGSAEERLFEIFKVMDHEVRHIGAVLESAGFGHLTPVKQDEAEQIFDRTSAATGITENSHER